MKFSAEDYDKNAKIQKISMQKLCESIEKIIQKNLAHYAPKTILDLGCGTGVHTQQFLNYFINYFEKIKERNKLNFKIIGIDLLNNFKIPVSHTRLFGDDRGSDIPTIHFIQENFEHLENFENIYFIKLKYPDWIISNFALHWSSDMLKLLEGLLKIPENKLLAFTVPLPGTFSELNHPPDLVSEHEIKKILNQKQEKFKKIFYTIFEKRFLFKSYHDALLSLKLTGTQNFKNQNKNQQFTGLLTQSRLKNFFNSADAPITLTYRVGLFVCGRFS